MQNEPQLSAEMEQELIKEIDYLLFEYKQDNDRSRIDNVLESVDKALATALADERERIKRCLMPVIDLDECNHEEGIAPVEDNIGKYHVASGVCCKCGASVLDWKHNEPQLSAEMEKRFNEAFAHLSVLIDQALSYTYVDSKNMGELKIKDIKHFLATALEEQKIKSYDEGFLAGKMYARMTTIDEVEGWLVEEPEHFVSSKNPANMGKNNIKAKIKNELRAELRAKLVEMKEGE